MRAALLVVARRDDEALPDFLPIGGLEAALGAGSADAPTRGPAARDADARLPLVSLLARVLMRYALDWQTGTRLPLVGWADLLRVLDDSRPVPLRELTRLTGIAKETLAVLSGRLEHARCLRSEPLSGAGRGRQLRLTERERLPWYPMVTHRGGYPDGA